MVIKAYSNYKICRIRYFFINDIYYGNRYWIDIVLDKEELIR